MPGFGIIQEIPSDDTKTNPDTSSGLAIESTVHNGETATETFFRRNGVAHALRQLTQDLFCDVTSYYSPSAPLSARRWRPL